MAAVWTMVRKLAGVSFFLVIKEMLFSTKRAFTFIWICMVCSECLVKLRMALEPRQDDLHGLLLWFEN